MDSDEELLLQFSEDSESIDARLAAAAQQHRQRQQPGYAYTAVSKRQRRSRGLTAEVVAAELARAEEQALREAAEDSPCMQQQRRPAGAEADQDAPAPQQDMPSDPYDPTDDSESDTDSPDAEQTAEEEAAALQQTEPPSRTDGWCLVGDWAITIADNSFTSTRGPFIWSFYRSAGVSYASFDVSFLRGIARLDKSLFDIIPPRRNKAKFAWRGRETGEGEMQIDDSSQTGELTFKQQAGGFMVLEGVLRGPHCSGEGLRFIGSRVKDTPSHTNEYWSSYNARAYEEERVGRWR